MDALTRSNSVRAWVSLVLGLAGVLTLPAAVEVARRSSKISLLDAAYAVPLAFLLGLVAVVMGRRARDNIRWLRLEDAGTRTASAGLIVGALAICLALSAALSVGFYQLFLLYEHHR